MDKCPHCLAEVYKHELTKYCMSCGKNLRINTCKNSTCVINKEQTLLPEWASHCPVCGSDTTLNEEIPF